MPFPRGTDLDEEELGCARWDRYHPKRYGFKLQYAHWAARNIEIIAKNATPIYTGRPVVQKYSPGSPYPQNLWISGGKLWIKHSNWGKLVNLFEFLIFGHPHIWGVAWYNRQIFFHPVG